MQPLNITLDSVSYTWVAVYWDELNDLGSYEVSYYNITVYKIILHNRMEILITEISTGGNETRANITGLQPGTKFRIQVAGIGNITDSKIIALGQSASLWVNTSIPGKMIICMHPGV